METNLRCFFNINPHKKYLMKFIKLKQHMKKNRTKLPRRHKKSLVLVKTDLFNKQRNNKHLTKIHLFKK
jgi:hypothetical protein